MSASILAIVFLAVASASLIVHAIVLLLIVRIGQGTQTTKGYTRLRRTLRTRVVGATLYTVTGAVAVFVTPTTAVIALFVFAAMTTFYAISSIQDWLSWKSQQALVLVDGQYEPGASHRPGAGRHCDAGAHRPRGSRPSPVPRCGSEDVQGSLT